MKKFLPIVFVFTLLVSLISGCTADAAETHPETAAPTEAAAQVAAQPEVTLAEQLALPDRFTGKWDGLEDTLRVTADAEIILPDFDALPTATVTRQEITQEFADKLMDYFLGDAQLMKDNGMTRQDAQEKLEQYYAVQRGEKDLSEMTMDHTMEELPQIIARWEENAKTYPEERYTPIDRSFVDTGFGPSIAGIAQVDGETVQVDIRRGTSDDCVDFVFGDTPNTWGYMGRTFLSEDLEEDAYWLENYQLTAEDVAHFREDVKAIDLKTAQTQAEKVLADLGLETFTLYSAEPIVFASQEGAYSLTYARTVSGIQIAPIIADAAETLEIWVGRDGLLKFMWWNPFQTPVIQEEVAQLLPFADIADVFAKMIFVKNSEVKGKDYRTVNDINGFVVQHDFAVDKVQLNLMRVRDKGSFSQGRIVPVWDFWAETHAYTDSQAHKHLVYDGSYYRNILTINALDGSIIDRELGY